MANPLIRKLRTAGGLTDADQARLDRLCAKPRRVRTHEDLICEGDRPKHVHLVLEGFACRYKLMPEGRRQIMAVLLPGDFCDLHGAILGEMDHSIMALTPATVVTISRPMILDLTHNHPRINHALWWATLMDEGILRAWLANLGQRDADARMAHFFCEMLIRLQQAGLADENSYAMPFRQTELGDILGISSMHVNRSLQTLRGDDLIVLQKRHLHIPDVDRLKAFCGFKSNYLQGMPHAEKPRSYAA